MQIKFIQKQTQTDMKKLFFAFIVFAASAVNVNVMAEEESNEIFTVVETMPEFPGGQKALFQYLAQNTQYPVAAIQQQIDGRVICQFVVEKDGTVDSVNVIRSIHPLLDAEAIRVVSSMPKWKPAMQRGTLVRVRYTIPVNFKLQLDTVAEQTVIKEEKQNSEPVFVNVERMPEFQGGKEALISFLNSTVKYPLIAVENNIEGKVIVQFVVEKDGSITNVEVVKSVDPSLDREAKRVISAMPKWNPGYQSGKPVRVKYTVPVNFALPRKNKTY